MQDANIVAFKPTPKQYKAWLILNDHIVSEFGYGGGAGGGKSWLGCFWLATIAETYPGTRSFMGRKELKNLKRTTLATFFKMCAFYGWESGRHFTYNQQDSIIYWHNGSEILLLDLAYQPRDPLFLRFGGMEFTIGFADESNEVRVSAIEILKTRIGRQMNEEYNLQPKIFETFNPDKGHVYSRYYKPSRDGVMPLYMRFIKALPTDNPHLPASYIEQLKRSEKVTRERMLYGNFEYDDDPSALFEHDVILDLFTNSGKRTGIKYLICDVARKGVDKMIIELWDGLHCYRTITVPYKIKSNHVLAKEFILKICKEEGIRMSNVLLDEDGIGGGLVDELGCKGFVNNSRVIKPRDHPDDQPPPNFANLKTQCYFELADYALKGKIGITVDAQEVRDCIIEELEQVKEKDMDKDTKKSLIGKDVIKEHIGRSPDYSDTLMMRMYFELDKPAVLEPFFL
jgi:phage terminase large subunit